MLVVKWRPDVFLYAGGRTRPGLLHLSTVFLSVSSEVLCVAVGDGEGAARRQMLHETQAPVLGEYLYALLKNLTLIITI